jgi:hypothetical protein
MRAHIRRFRKTLEKNYETHHRSSGRRTISGGVGHGAGRARFNGATEFQGFSPSGGAVGLVTYFGPWGFSGGHRADTNTSGNTASRRAASVHHWPWSIGPAWLEQKAEGY